MSIFSKNRLFIFSSSELVVYLQYDLRAMFHPVAQKVKNKDRLGEEQWNTPKLGRLFK